MAWQGLAEIGAGDIEEVTSPTQTHEPGDGYGKPPAGRRFRKGRSGNPCGPRGKEAEPWISLDKR